VCERAVEVLAWLGADSVGPLLSIAGRPGEARVPAIRALSRLRDLRSAESLSRLLADDDPNVRCAAAGALGELSDPRVAPRLLEAATDSDHRVREAALEAVHKLRPIAVAADDDGAAQHAVRLASRTGLRG
jgi:HEAT repeat protein